MRNAFFLRALLPFASFNHFLCLRRSFTPRFALAMTRNSFREATRSVRDRLLEVRDQPLDLLLLRAVDHAAGGEVPLPLRGLRREEMPPAGFAVLDGAGFSSAHAEPLRGGPLRL